VTERDALLRGVIECPDDDLPRLVMADYLEENGEGGYAEFIRLQCELARPCCRCDDKGTLLGCAGDRENPECGCGKLTLRRRERELLKSHWRGWVSPELLGIWNDHIAERTLHARREMPEHAFHFTRGFVAEITLPAEEFLRVERGLLWCPSPCPNDCFQLEPGEPFIAGKFGTCTGCGGVGKVPPTDGCSACDGAGHPIVRLGGLSARRLLYQCSRCLGTGRVPRPFPATAQPVLHVTISDIARPDDPLLEEMRRRCPGVTFTHAPGPAPVRV
jgi:uncharacterized protein (TIGR02996 family)